MTDRAVTLELTPDTLAYIKRAYDLLGKERFYEAVRVFFDKEAGKAAGVIGRNVLKTLRQQGNLARSITGRGELVEGIPACRVGIFEGPSLQYAGVQEFGTKGKEPSSPYPTIKPKKAKTLAVPVESSLTASGVPRFPGPRQDSRDLKFELIGRGNLVGKLVIDKVKKDRVKARDAFRKAREARRSSLAFLEGDKSPGAREARKTLRSAERRAATALTRVTSAIDRESVEGTKTAYLLLRKVDIKPKHYLRKGFLEFLPILAQRLGVFAAQAIAEGEATP